MRNRISLAALALLLVSCVGDGPTAAPRAQLVAPHAVDAVLPLIRISEIHYDNSGTDAGEAIEISAPGGTSLAGYQLVLYNGSATSLASYNTRVLSATVVTSCGERGVVVETYPSNGIQNGVPDGIALVDPAGAVVEFLSYGGPFTASNGPAIGILATDIGVVEPSTTPIGQSLQRDSTGTWAAPATSTFGACNDGSSNTPPDDEEPPPPTGLPATRFSEIHYDNTGADLNEAIEIEGPAGTNVTGWSIVLYNQTGGVRYSTTLLSGVLPSQCGGRGTMAVLYPADGIQNGTSDGFALVNLAGAVVEFLSYEGTLTATDGPAAGMTSTDIGTFEPSTTPVGRSLQRRADGTWTTAIDATIGGCFGTTPPPPSNSISFSGRTPFDAALPVGFEDQVFATLRSGAGVTIPTTFTWTSETPVLATIDASGVMHALGVGTVILRATATDGTSATYSLPTRLGTFGATALYGNHVEFGEPADADASDDFLVRRATFTSSYNRVKGTPNWVSYNLEASHFGAEDRCDCFTFDPELPAGFTRYTTADYTGAGTFHGYGIDRGHLARSFDRTSGSLDNATTFYFTNIIPQAADNNQGPWAAMENHLGDLARFSNREVYVIAGVAGSKGTIKNEGKITIPSAVWKVAVVLPHDAGLTSVNSWQDVQVIAAVMPNDPGIRNVNWETYRTTVDAVEALSGYDLLALLRDDIEIAVESDTRPPAAALDGPYTAYAGDPLVVSGASSTDADGDALTYAWDFGDGSAASDATSGATASHTYVAPGTFTVRLIVTDIRGLADTVSTPANITLLPPAVGVARAIDMIEALEASGALSHGNANSLAVKLQAAQKQLERDHAAPVDGQLGAVMNEIDAMVQSGRLTAEQAAPILEVLTRSRNNLGG